MQIVIFIVAIALFAAGVWLGYLDKAGVATATYGAAVLSLIFAFLPEFKKFKGLGIEAELLDKKIEETDKLLQQLRDITVPIAEMLLSSTARVGRLSSGMPRSQKYELVQRIESELKKCGVEESQLDKAKEDWHYYNTFDLATPIFNKISAKLQPIHQERNKVLNQFSSQTITPDRMDEHKRLIEHRNIVTQEMEAFKDLRQIKNQSLLADKIRGSILNSVSLSEDSKRELVEELEEELRDLEHYIKFKEFRRLSVWFGNDQCE
ncbi:TPA: hypothetical protein I7787_21915 [Vibrio vulnificus]|uniref:hypothetical protein n=1 Tax=Vibrio vulnificus TaxID=672 RepID=UPI000927A0FE|nr:hypothetical protein [Vibrio vulnificus]EGQ9781657.1 hypothetical protein [Vibrio vulnificus]EHZ2746746.1 hypothetical protein [Vibrio vulnificus]ELK8439507.1 hypothetical protein [Vibrio vulnificus]ELX4135258.1 hypothetical protein [Vibrio vulnificus]ELX4180503.1 hypothetical protein [Vibrio vulnificus]